MMTNESLGFDEWFGEKIEREKYPYCIPARVISVNKNSYVVSEGEREIYAELTGKFIFNSETSLDFPTAGDWVYAQFFDDDSLALIHDIFPRKSLLKRKTPGKKVEHQLIAANVDTAIIMQAADTNYNLRRLERYLVMINESGINPMVLLSKSDLRNPDEVEIMKEEINALSPGIALHSFSNSLPSDIEKIKSLLLPRKTYCLLGSSGVGKTTLLNNLIHQELYKTQPIREKDGRGKHTTTRRELIVIDNGAVIIDSPGMRELGVITADSGLNSTFDEIAELAGYCKYDDCSHTIEKGCKVLQGLEEGTVSKERYDNYIKILKETRYNEMSYLEKKQKERKFGKFMHDYQKNHNHKNR